MQTKGKLDGMLDGMSINIICPIMNIELASITNFNVIKCKINCGCAC